MEKESLSPSNFLGKDLTGLLFFQQWIKFILCLIVGLSIFKYHENIIDQIYLSPEIE